MDDTNQEPAGGEEQPEQTDNTPREEDGEQDVNQEPEPTEGSV